ncbi:mCG1027444, partial [Mus musculus]
EHPLSSILDALLFVSSHRNNVALGHPGRARSKWQEHLFPLQLRKKKAGLHPRARSTPGCCSQPLRSGEF